MSAMAPQITSLTIVYSTVYSKHRSKKTSKPPVTGLWEGIQWSPVNSSHKGPVTRKMFLFDDVIMCKGEIWGVFCRYKLCSTLVTVIMYAISCYLIVAWWCHMVTEFWVNIGSGNFFCLTAPSQYSNQCWLIINEVLWCTFHGNDYVNSQNIDTQVMFEILTFEITATSPKCQLIKPDYITIGTPH